ncbi:MAG: hypothetical protein ACK2UF_12545, partial [Candidatus Promineifilaceae bacterium]
MKKYSLILTLLIIGLMVLAACGTNLPETEVPAVEEATPVEEEAEAPAEAPTEAPAEEEAAAPEELLFVAINKSADQQYF